MSFHNNMIELWDFSTSILSKEGLKKLKQSAKANKAIKDDEDDEEGKDEEGPYKKVCSIELEGHRSDIRALALSYDDSLLMSASSGNYTSTKKKRRN